MRSSTNVSLYKIAHTIAAEKRKDTRNQFLIQMLPSQEVFRIGDRG
jgi:hypothetical protein